MIKKFFVTVFIVIGVLGLSGWGFMVHRTVNQLAIYQLPKQMQSFFYLNKAYLVDNAPRPDQRRATDSTEGNKHFLDFEYYGDSTYYTFPRNWSDAVSKYGADTLYKYGTLPFTVVATLDKLTRAFKNKQRDSILYYAADLGHYIGDANVPLHTSINYDGQLTNQRGIHDLWETTVPEVVFPSYKIQSKHTAKYITDPVTRVWEIMHATHQLLPDMLEKEKEVSKQFTDSTKYRWEVRWGKNRRFYSQSFAKAYSAALKNSINQQLILSSEHLADFWYTAWINAGSPDLANLLTAPYCKKAFKKERKAFRNDRLMEKGWLMSRQHITKD